jgi:hypothetical protein
MRNPSAWSQVRGREQVAGRQVRAVIPCCATSATVRGAGSEHAFDQYRPDFRAGHRRSFGGAV